MNPASLLPSLAMISHFTQPYNHRIARCFPLPCAWMIGTSECLRLRLRMVDCVIIEVVFDEN